MKIRILLNTFLIVFSFLAIVKAEEHAVNVPANSNSAVQQQLQGFNLNGYSDEGKKTWEVNGDKADISDEKIKVTKVDANFYGKENANLKSDTGTINKSTGQIHLQDNVVVTADRGTQMTTDTLDWDRNKDLVTTKDPVRITDSQGVVTGKGLTAHPNLKQAAINKDVKAIMNANSDPDSASDQKVT
ncbi:MAG: LPS export ABC transporter periplasmic protein LptC, partial [Candidatus Omnitrophota bacterium]